LALAVLSDIDCWPRTMVS